MVNGIYTKSFLERIQEELPEWQRIAFELLAETLGDDADTFPCIPRRHGKTAQRRNWLRSRDTGKYASLVVLFDTPEDLAEHYSIEAYEELFWRFLNRLSHQDEKEWPEDIPADPEHYKWEFCFDGEPYFLCATPAHEARKSQSFPFFMITFQPRWVFEDLNGSTAFGRNMSRLIRSRLEAYDQAPIHPQLGWYGGKDNREWKQYFLRDDEKQVSKCPFSYLKNMFNKMK